MSPDLREALRRAAPEPALGFDEGAVASRARRGTIIRMVGAATVLIALLATTTLVVTSRETNELGIGGGDRDASERAGGPQIPAGPRHEVLSGRFGEDWQRDPGKTWRLLVWGDQDTQCWQLAVAEEDKTHGTHCSTPPKDRSFEDTPFAGSTSFQTGSADPDDFLFVTGAVAPQVEMVEFRPEEGDVVEIDLADAPPGSGATLRYYAATLPRFDRADMVAFDAAGEPLETHHLCGPGCREERQREQDAKVAEYEAQPIALISKAAAFANLAVGHADLDNPFGTHYVYQGIRQSGEMFRAAFEVRQCEPPRGPDGEYTCNANAEQGHVDVALEGTRFVVVAAEGPMTPDQRERLLGFTFPSDGFSPQWRQAGFTIVREQDRRHWGIAWSLVWMGNLPPPVAAYGSVCQMVVYDDDGNVLQRGRPLPMEVRSGGERFRVSGLSSGLEPEVKDPQELMVDCDEPRANPET